jgi:hypothetical protein
MLQEGADGRCKRYLRDLKKTEPSTAFWPVLAPERRHEAHLIVTHEVTNVGIDRNHFSPMAEQAREAPGSHMDASHHIPASCQPKPAFSHGLIITSRGGVWVRAMAVSA